MKSYKNLDLTNYNSYRIKSTCKTAFFPETEADIIKLYSTKKDYILLGSGHNIILSKSYYEKEFIIFNGNFDTANIDEESETVIAESGISMQKLAMMAQENGLSGIEIFYDIPSSLGGAIVMNAGASGEEIKDVLIKVRYLDLETMEIKEVLQKDIDFEYRNSFFQRNNDKIVLKAWLKLTRKDKTKIQEKMESIKAQRWAKQPKDFPNAGSVFKRPKGYYVGTLIDELGLKGYTEGGAKISEKHGGFIINSKEATGHDILKIINHVKKTVKKRFKIDLEIEQRII
ncbi:UDP-N-acetylenolpyruvoylglucosamine reductase [Lunatimonas lonarensis]|uniref:UDP-N-acetylenolpyruvoylglucosamine reductase n=1 Tax=Lunatimonas lonarensis TaxID=1232681 RepID=R7ZP96_9BACT|nr:UDP-N-acetylmuramate dehydrogenase [Lunatimonas lonarensis]EON75883.1 UDP-N-acetylenolpyruvoylglucosamine reductase [Lunatimonas lonarensis]